MGCGRSGLWERGGTVGVGRDSGRWGAGTAAHAAVGSELGRSLLCGCAGQGGASGVRGREHETPLFSLPSTPKPVHAAPLACLRDRPQSLGHFPPRPTLAGWMPEWIQASTSCAACTPVVVEPRVVSPAHRMRTRTRVHCVWRMDARGWQNPGITCLRLRTCLSPWTQLGNIVRVFATCLARVTAASECVSTAPLHTQAWPRPTSWVCRARGSKWSQEQGARDTIVLFALSTKTRHAAPLACLRDRPQSLGHFPPGPPWLGG